MEKERIYDKNEEVNILFDEYWRENEGGEWSIPSIIGGVDF